MRNLLAFTFVCLTALGCAAQNSGSSNGDGLNRTCSPEQAQLLRSFIVAYKQNNATEMRTSCKGYFSKFDENNCTYVDSSGKSTEVDIKQIKGICDILPTSLAENELAEKKLTIEVSPSFEPLVGTGGYASVLVGGALYPSLNAAVSNASASLAKNGFCLVKINNPGALKSRQELIYIETLFNRQGTLLHLGSIGVELICAGSVNTSEGTFSSEQLSSAGLTQILGDKITLKP